MDKNLDLKKQVFYSHTHGPVNADGVIDLISSYLDEDQSSVYTLVIGTDSHETGRTTLKTRSINLVTAIVIHRHGHGGKYFWQRKHIKNIHTLREKIYTETFASLNFAYSFVPDLQKKLNGKSPSLEIH
ncbi:ribonuclease H-like YkuK family protein, partial [Patescibacteria group bacterium]|nr:ribonuclease H-like YkuK family protein [Patescibacteria group bacterium]